MDVEKMLRSILKSSKRFSVPGKINYLLNGKGKRIRPALVLLCAKIREGKGSCVVKRDSQKMIKAATAIELLHIASLIHDDLIDHADKRHNKPTINHKWGGDMSIALGDYLYAVAFELVSGCGDKNILECIIRATKEMSGGELIQVCERDNLGLKRKRYILIARKKTASLFSAACSVGALLGNNGLRIQNILKAYGSNFGVAFQIRDDCLDLMGKEKELGKPTGKDFAMGEITLPLLNLISFAKNKKKVIALLRKYNSKTAFKNLRKEFKNEVAYKKTKEDLDFYIRNAKKVLNFLDASSGKSALFALADYISPIPGLMEPF